MRGGGIEDFIGSESVYLIFKQPGLHKNHGVCRKLSMYDDELALCYRFC